jgi:hypothetical protein
MPEKLLLQHPRKMQTHYFCLAPAHSMEPPIYTVETENASFCDVLNQRRVLVSKEIKNWLNIPNMEQAGNTALRILVSAVAPRHGRSQTEFGMV